MKRAWLIILGGLALAVCAYACIYFRSTAAQRSVEQSARPELAWLQIHFYKVAQTMPPEQGRRYLDWVQQQTLKPSKMMPGGTQTNVAPGKR